MIKIENTEVVGFKPAIRGMRNPMNSWDKSDSHFIPMEWCDTKEEALLADVCGKVAPIIGENDMKLMKSLTKAGTDHSKYLRMIVVYADITAPLYWWKEYDTYKVGTVANSCSTMHKIADHEFSRDDFSHEHLDRFSLEILDGVIKALNISRRDYLENDKERHEYLETTRENDWWQMIQLLPSSYNQKRTVMLNYQVLKNIYFARRNHKLDEWHDFCRWIERLPYFREIILEA